MSSGCRTVVSLTVACLALAGCGEAARDAFRPIEVGQPAPDYAAVSLAGDSVSLTALRGDAVMLNLWATWCGPCREEMPGLQRLSEVFADSGLTVVGVSVDARNAAADVRNFVRDFGITFLILRDPDERVSRTFRTVGVPETFLIDREGTLVHRWIGQFDPMAPDVHDVVRRALGGAAAAD